MNEYKPALTFLAKFLAVYFVGNILYAMFIEHQGNRPDVITISTTAQTATCLSLAGFETTHRPNLYEPTVSLMSNNLAVVNVYEGCNGVNVMIVFVAFVFAFGGNNIQMTWFIPLGILIIHAFNLCRIVLLYFLATYSSEYFYYFHKFFFTAILYSVVFGLWLLWVLKLHGYKIKTVA